MSLGTMDTQVARIHGVFSLNAPKAQCLQQVWSIQSMVYVPVMDVSMDVIEDIFSLTKSWSSTPYRLGSRLGPNMQPCMVRRIRTLLGPTTYYSYTRIPGMKMINCKQPWTRLRLECLVSCPSPCLSTRYKRDFLGIWHICDVMMLLASDQQAFNYLLSSYIQLTMQLPARIQLFSYQSGMSNQLAYYINSTTRECVSHTLTFPCDPIKIQACLLLRSKSKTHIFISKFL